MRAASILLPLFLAGCAEDTSGPSPETNPRFVGEWMIDQPAHALYEASWYLFHDDGRLEHLRDCSFGGPVPTGSVDDASVSIRCLFGDRWSAPDGDTLVVSGTCSDGNEREIVLGFPADATGNAGGVSTIEVVSVGGETGWGHFTFDWVWHKCGESGCASALECP
jgi:hypothetical protein